MANEKRLIDANALTKELEFLAKHEDYWKRNTILGVVHTIRQRPTVDAVEVVRCKDCKHYGNYGRVWDCRNYSGMRLPNDDDFCSYRERRDENEKA